MLKIGSCQHWFGVFVSVGHKGVMGRNSIPEGKYYLADAGYPLCDALLVPFQGVCYHLREWEKSGLW